MQIGAGASAGRPVTAGSLAKGDPAASGALHYIREGRRAPAGALGRAAPRRATAPASASLAAAGQCAASFPPGVREGGRIRASAFRPQCPPPPALQRRAGSTQVVFRSGGAGPGTFI